jgi:hypothetical protein
MSGSDFVLLGPPLVLLAMAAGACAWLALGAARRRVRTTRGAVTTSLNRAEMGPAPDSREHASGRGSPGRNIPVSPSVNERSLR